MNKMKTNTLLSLLAAICLSVSTSAYGQKHASHFSPEEFKAKLENFISCNASLSTAEAQKFFPLYHELRNKQRQINHQIMQLKRTPLPADAKDKQYSDVVIQIAELKEEAAKLESTYLKRMCKAIPAHKVYQVIKAEDTFHRNMLRGAGHKKPSPQKRR